jgi:hypothetical protein
MLGRTASATSGSGGTGIGGSLSRGQLLRDIGLLSTNIIATHARFTDASSRHAAASTQVGLLSQQVKVAEGDLKRLRDTVTAEREHDPRLASLRRGVQDANTRKQEVSKWAKAMRAQRDKLVEELKTAYYARLGAVLEALTLLHSDALPVGGLVTEGPGSSPAPVTLPLQALRAAPWPQAVASLLAAYEGLWKKTAVLGEDVRDVLDANLQMQGLQLLTNAAPAAAVGEDDVTPPPTASSKASGLGVAAAVLSRGGAGVYVTLGDAALQARARYLQDALLTLGDQLGALNSQREAVAGLLAANREAVHAAAAAAEGSEDAAAAGAAVEECKRDAAPLVAVDTIAALIGQNLLLQQSAVSSLLIAYANGSATVSTRAAASGSATGDR